MNIGLYMDVHIPYAVTCALRLRGLDVLTVQEDGADQLSDSTLLDRATNLARILFSQDNDFSARPRLQRSGRRFLGLIYAHHSTQQSASASKS